MLEALKREEEEAERRRKEEPALALLAMKSRSEDQATSLEAKMEDTVVLKEDETKISRRIEEGLRRWEEEGLRKREEEVHRRHAAGNGAIPKRDEDVRENGKRKEPPRKISGGSMIGQQRCEEERLLRREMEEVSRRRKDGIVQRDEVIIVEGGQRRKISSGQELPVPAPRKRDDRSHSESHSHSHSHSHSKKTKSHSSSHSHPHSKSQSLSSTLPRQECLPSSTASPRRDSKRSMSPKRDHHQSSCSPHIDAKRSTSSCEERKRSKSPRKDAKRSVSPKKEPRQSKSEDRRSVIMCHHTDRPISPRESTACYRDEKILSPRVSAILPRSLGEEAMMGPMSPRHVQEPAFSSVTTSTNTPRREPQPRTISLGTSMGSSIEAGSTTGGHFTDTQPRTTSMGTSMGSSMETTTGEQEPALTTPKFFKGAPVVAVRGGAVQPVKVEENIRHQSQADSQLHSEPSPGVLTHSSRDSIDPIRNKDVASHHQQRELKPEIEIRSPALSCPVPRPPTSITSSAAYAG